MVTSIHPNLLLDRPLTEKEMMDALDYEGMFGIGIMDIPVAMSLYYKGKLLLTYWDRLRGWNICSTK